MLTRRTFLLVPLAVPLAGVVNAQSAAPGKMLLSIHQNTVAGRRIPRIARGLGEGWDPVRRAERQSARGIPRERDVARCEARSDRSGTDTGFCRRRTAGYLDPGSGTGGIARDVEKALRSVRKPWPAENLLRVDNQPERHRGRLRGNPGLHPRNRRDRPEVQPHGDGRIPPHVNPPGNADLSAQGDSRGGASQRPAHARLLPLLVGPEQVRRSGLTPAGRARPRAFSGSASIRLAS